MRDVAAMPAQAAPTERRKSEGRHGSTVLAWCRQFPAGFGVLLFTLVAIVGPQLLPYDPLIINLADRVKPPGAVLADGSRTWLGTDQVGTDVLAQVVQGARISLLVGVATISIAGLAGLVIGVIAGFFGGLLDALLMRIADVQLAFPSILFAILIASVLGPSVFNVIVTLSISRWVIFARVARSTTLVGRERDFVVAARSLGATNRQLLIRHIVPFTLAPFLILVTLEMGLAIIAEASLSFLGLGTPPEQPSWGLTIANGRDYLSTAWWVSTAPGIALSLFVLSLGLLGEQLRRALDPRAATRRR